MPFTFVGDFPGRFGLLNTEANSADSIKWFETDPHVIIHTANAWEADGKVYMYACGYNKLSLELEAKSDEGKDRSCIGTVTEYNYTI